MSQQLTREDLYDWVKEHGCIVEPFKGINNTASQIKIVNPNYPNAYSYLDIPLNNKPVPDFVVCKVCDELYIKHPDCVDGEVELVSHLKNKFADKKFNFKE